jgi:uncharacterized membrane protein
METTIVRETHSRSFVKSLIWRIMGVVLLGAVTYFYTRHWIQTSWITFLHHGVFLFIFWGHERFWLCVNMTGLKRKFCKMFTYESILGFLVLGVISLVVTGNVQTMSKITLTYIFIKHIIYVINEFLWDHIKWGISQWAKDNQQQI